MFILKEFQTCGVSSTIDVAQLDTFILEIIKIQLVVSDSLIMIINAAFSSVELLLGYML